MRILQLIVSGTLANAGRPERVIKNKQLNPPQQQLNHLKCQTKVEIYYTVISDVLPNDWPMSAQPKIAKKNPPLCFT
jgi:hypothetical protein